MGIKPLVHVLQGNRLEKSPVWFMRQAGRYLPEYRQIRSKHATFRDFLFATNDVVEVTLQPLRRYDLDAAIIFSDILVVPMIMGLQVDVIEKIGPQVEILKTPDDVLNLNREGDFNLCIPIYEAISKVKQNLDPSKTLLGFSGGPWTLATYMLEGKTGKDFLNTKLFAYEHGESFNQLIDLTVEITAKHLINQIEAGADAIKIFDSWAGSIPYNRVGDWLIEPHKKLVEKIRAIYPEIPIIAFLRGAEGYYADYINQVSVNALALGTSCNLKQQNMSLPKTLTLQGALDPIQLVAGGKNMIEAIENQARIFSNRPYIFNLGHGIVPQTPPEHVELAIKTIRSM